MSLRHAELKAARAFEHLEELKRELETYYASDPCAITRYRRHEIGLRFLRIDFKDFSDRTYLLVGDFAHNLRACLDYVVFSLVTHTTHQLPESKVIQWPVQDRPDEHTFKRQTRGVPGPALEVIKKLQPYQAGEHFREHPLRQLHRLDIVDKHRRITINHTEFRVGSAQYSRHRGHRYYTGESYIEFSFPIDSPSIEIRHSKPEIEFGAEDEGLSLKPERLEELYKFVTDDVLPRFRQFFDSPAIG